ncbi:MAG: hypothetical protein GY842_02340 [bacterium]|nr:hypothetical protein [bacterium]
MAKRTLKVALLAAVCGSMLGWGGCLDGDSWWGYVVRDAALSATYEFLWDNDAVFDLFQDDFGTGALYDDRFTAAPTRAEP